MFLRGLFRDSIVVRSAQVRVPPPMASKARGGLVATSRRPGRVHEGGAELQTQTAPILFRTSA
jgi:hypothetical protein